VTWDPRYHGSVMMEPVLFCVCIMSIVAATFAAFVGLRLWQYRVAKRPFRDQAREPHDEEEVVYRSFACSRLFSIISGAVVVVVVVVIVTCVFCLHGHKVRLQTSCNPRAAHRFYTLLDSPDPL
jgi:archaellum biogenesis protein FlaJ (TadC family)